MMMKWLRGWQLTRIPEEPDNLDELRSLLDRDFEVIQHGLPDPNFRPGGISRTRQMVKCPFCSHVFTQEISSGCFNITKTPMWCPECSFPENIRDKWLKLMKDRRHIQDNEGIVNRLGID